MKSISTADITVKEIDELIRYLPLIGEPSTKNERKWDDPAVNSSGTLEMGFPIYPAVVRQFFELASQSCWIDRNYDPRRIGEMIQDDGQIASASLAQIREMLTYCVRGERFCDGHWGDMIKSGRIAAILRRLTEIRAEMK